MGDTNFRRTGKRTTQGPYRSEVSERKRREADERNASWAAMSTADKLAELDARLGYGMGAVKQRTRLTA